MISRREFLERTALGGAAQVIPGCATPRRSSLADRRQLLAAYPQFPAFLSAKRRFDPAERFQSDWYRHYQAVLRG